MRDANGGIVILVVIVVFIIASLGYLAFNVNYTKAFRMKNKIISIYEDYDGNCNSKCIKAINEYARTIGYNLGRLSCPTGFKKGNNLYCYKEVKFYTDTSKSSIPEIKKNGNDDKCKNTTDLDVRYYYTIITKINVQIPIMSKILDFKFFQISGDTKSFVKDMGC